MGDFKISKKTPFKLDCNVRRTIVNPTSPKCLCSLWLGVDLRINTKRNVQPTITNMFYDEPLACDLHRIGSSRNELSTSLMNFNTLS
jgi:hypothetical protein